MLYLSLHFCKKHLHFCLFTLQKSKNNFELLQFKQDLCKTQFFGGFLGDSICKQASVQRLHAREQIESTQKSPKKWGIA